MIVVVKGEMPPKEKMPEGLQKYIQTNTCTGTSHILTNPELSIILSRFFFCEDNNQIGIL